MLEKTKSLRSTGFPDLGPDPGPCPGPTRFDFSSVPLSLHLPKSN